LVSTRVEERFVPESFTGKAAIVTGAGSGMGRASAIAFAEAGASVLIADINGDGARETFDMVTAAGGSADVLETDVGDNEQVRRMVDRAITSFGSLDFAVNCAAVELETGLLVDCEESIFDRLVRVNLKSIFLCLKHEIRAMREQGRGGAIVNIASVNSVRPQPMQSVYTATKHGVLGLTKTAAIEYAGDAIRVNAICPGAIDTPMLRNALQSRPRDEGAVVDKMSLLGRLGEPNEVAYAARWLCSSEASYILGATLAVDAGYLAR